MKIFVVPDLHGRQCWQQPTQVFLDANPDGKVVFLGDYPDSFHHKDFQLIECLTDVILFKTKYPDHVVLLLGNHDFPYLYYDASGATGYRCSGYRPSVAYALHCLYKDHEHLFQLAYQIQAEGFTYLFVHAGVTRFWLEHNQLTLQAIADLAQTETISELLNACLQTQRGRNMVWQVSSRSGGYNPVDGPIWVRPQELGQGVLANYIQVVGHTGVKGITRAINPKGTTGAILTDCLHEYQTPGTEDKNEYLTLEIQDNE